MEYKLTTRAEHDGAETYTESSESIDMLTLARQIDSSLNTRIKALLKDISMYNECLQIFNNEILIPVGSSQDGSKVNVPGDHGDGGDVDILLVSKTAILDESNLEYDSRYPAFLRVRGDRTHSQLFKWKRLVEDVYVPVKVLKNLERRMYGIVRSFVSFISLPGISGKYFNCFKETAVGFEIAALDRSSTMGALHMTEVQEQRVNILHALIKPFHYILNSFSAMVHKGDPHDFPKGQSSFSNESESVTSAAIKIAALIRDKDNDNGNFKMRIEINEREPRTDPIYKSSLSNEKAVEEPIQLHKLMTADIVPAFNIEGWPRVAEEWLSRHRKWPSNHLVQIIKKIGCQIVAKRPLFPDLNGDRNNEDHSSEADENDTCFRLSFSQCELALAKQLSEVPLLCWKILKAYQKGVLSTEPPVLTSYHWKTVLFWIREDTDDDFWSEENLLNCVITALDFMINCLQKRFLPLYFVHEENLIAGCRDDLVVVTLNRVVEIRKAPFKYLSNFFEYPPKPDEYISSKEKLKEYLIADSHEHMVDDICKNMVHGVWSSIPIENTEDEHKCFFRRMFNNLRNFSMQLIKGDRMKHSSRVVLTDLVSFLDKVFPLIEDKDCADSDSETEQVLYSREQSPKHKTQREIQIWDMPSKENVQKDHTRIKHNSSTVQANEHTRTHVDIDDDKETSAVFSRKSTEQSDNSLSTATVDVKHIEFPQPVEEINNDQRNNEEISNRSTKQKDDSFLNFVMAGMKLLNDFYRLVSGEEVQDSNGGKYEFSPDVRRLVHNFIDTLIHHLSEEDDNNHENITDSCETNKSSRAPCDLDLD